jgi:hypothetical protein
MFNATSCPFVFEYDGERIDDLKLGEVAGRIAGGALLAIILVSSAVTAGKSRVAATEPCVCYRPRRSKDYPGNVG